MKNIISLILTLLFISSYGNWTEVSTPTNENLNKLEIINGTAFCVGNNGTLLKSVDEGDSWTEIFTSATGDINSILFLNQLTGFFTTSNGKVYKTTNGGIDWSYSNLQSKGINGLDFKKNLTTGIAVGDNGSVFRTIDGGNNWSEINSSSVYRINGITFINDSLAVCIGALSSYGFSTNSGESWTYTTLSNSSESFNSIARLNDSTAVIVGTNGSFCQFSESNLKIGMITKIDLEGDKLRDVEVTVKESSKVRVITVGYGSSINFDTYGWETADLDSINDLNGIHFYNDSIGLICGLNGKIYKTKSVGATSISSLPSLKTFEIYPNPTSNYIKIDNEFIGHDLTMYNMLGEIIFKKQIISTDFDISSLSSGNYFLQLTSKNSISKSRFIKK